METDKNIHTEIIPTEINIVFYPPKYDWPMRIYNYKAHFKFMGDTYRVISQMTKTLYLDLNHREKYAAEKMALGEVFDGIKEKCLSVYDQRMKEDQLLISNHSNLPKLEEEK